MHALLPAWLLLSVVSLMPAQTNAPQADRDSDHDGLSDSLETALLAQFAPLFMVSGNDCSVRPAQFIPFERRPIVQEENGTIYGQVFPRAGRDDQIEMHYYHLWRSDCGELSHNLDAEHVSVLLARDSESKWKALYWYASAHEDTVCDASQIARATTVDAELHGPRIWISRGKHASFLSDALCAHGCGGDVCREMEPLAPTIIVNLGELQAPMNGTIWAGSPQWPLAAKMSRSDFAEVRTARVDHLPVTSIAWANPEKQPMQAAIHGGKNTLDGVAAGSRATGTALDLADSNTGHALNGAAGSTGNGISMAIRGVGKALRLTARKIGDAIGAK